MRRKRTRSTHQSGEKQDIGLVDDMLPPYQPLGESGVHQIVDAALELLRDTGVGFEPLAETMEIFSAGGCQVSPEGVIRFPSELVRDAIQSTARSARLWNRPGTEYITLDRNHTWFLAGMTAIKVYDEQTGEPRTSNREDLVKITQLVDALPNIDGTSVTCKIVEQSNIHGEIEEFVVLAEHPSKPLEFLCEYAESLGVVIEIAETIRGGRDALIEKPFFSHVVTPLPLYYAATHIDQIIRATEYGIPLILGTVTIGGASAPITIAGCLVHALATDLAGLVLSHLVRPGSFCMLGSDVSFMEAATGGVGGVSQAHLGDLAICQIMRSLDLPSATGIAGGSSARRFDEDAVWEISCNMMQSFYARPATCDYLGLLDEGLTYSLHALAFCDEQVGLIRQLFRGIRVDDEMLARDLTREMGARGNYLAHTHTASHCREEFWNARYYGAKFPVASGTLADEPLFDRIERDIAALLQKHQPEKISSDILRQIRAIQARFKADDTGEE